MTLFNATFNPANRANLLRIKELPRMPRPKLIIPDAIWSEMVSEYERGEGPAAIAKRHGYNANTVATKLRRAGICRGADRMRTQGTTIVDTNSGGLEPSVIVEDTGSEMVQSGFNSQGGVSEHVPDQEVTRILASHRKRSKKLGGLLDSAVKEARNGCNVKDLQILTIAHERLVKLDRECLGVTGGKQDGPSPDAQVAVNNAVIVIPDKIGPALEDWREAIVDQLDPDSGG